MKLDTLDELNDAELTAVIARSEALLKSRDDDRKAKALVEAKALLASVGLSLQDIARGKSKAVKTPPYKGGRLYQHPSEKDLVWNAKGQKPGWLRELEAGGGKPLELPPAAAIDSASLPGKKFM